MNCPVGRLAGKTKKVATIQEINEAAADGCSGDKGPEMRVAVDTNVLLSGGARRQGAGRDRRQVAAKIQPGRVALSALGELVWALHQVYGFKAAEVADTIQSLIAADNVETNRPAVEAGLARMDAGGDFADRVISYEGRWSSEENLCITN